MDHDISSPYYFESRLGLHQRSPSSQRTLAVRRRREGKEKEKEVSQLLPSTTASSSASVRFAQDGDENVNNVRTMTDVTILVVPDSVQTRDSIQTTTIAKRDERKGSIYIDLQDFSGRLQILEGNFQSNYDRLGDNLQQESEEYTQLQPLKLPTKDETKNIKEDDGDDDDDKKMNNVAIEVSLSSFVGDHDEIHARSLASGWTTKSGTIQTTSSNAVGGGGGGRDNDNGDSGSGTNEEYDDDDDDDDDDDNEDDLDFNPRGVLNHHEAITNSSKSSSTTRMSFFQLVRLQHGLSNTVSSISQTPMHRLVGSLDLTAKKLQDLLVSQKGMVKVVDGVGRLPLHILGNNIGLISSLDGQIIAKQCVMMLVEAFPDGAAKTDNYGRVAFTDLIFNWVSWSHLRMEGKIGSREMPAIHPTRVRHLARHQLHNLMTKLQDWENQRSSKESGHGGSKLQEDFEATAAYAALVLNQSSNKFPSVMIFQPVEFAFQMLSLAMDYLSGNSFDPTKRGQRPMLSYKKQRLNRELLAQNLADIPQLFKTVLLLESKDVREEIFRSSVFRRAMFCQKSAGPWLTSMLRSQKGNSAEMAIAYLESISELSLIDYIGNFRIPLPKDEFLFEKAKTSIYDYIDDVNDVIPSLLVLREDLLDRAVTLDFICKLMTKKITTTFTVFSTVTDLLFHLCLLIAVRDISFGLYNSDSNWITTGTVVVVFIAGYQILRKVLELFVLAKMSTRIAKRQFFNSSNLLDFLGVLGALVTAGLGTRFESPLIPAIILGLLWFRILSFLKVINEQLATFIFALKKIFYDIRFFLLVFLILIFCFGDMFHLLYLTSPSIDCENLAGDDTTNDFCNENNLYSYLRVYAIILGDFELSSFQIQDAVTFLFVVLTLLGTIILLNVLIAVVTQSYEGAIETSVVIFRKSRAEFVVSHVAAERFMRPQDKLNQALSHEIDTEDGADSVERPLTSQGVIVARRAGSAIRLIVFRQLLRWFVAITCLFTISLATMYLIGRMEYNFTHQNSIFISVFFTIVFGALILHSMWAAIAIIISFFIQYITQTCQVEIGCTWLRKMNEAIMRRAASFMFGIDTSDQMVGGISAVEANTKVDHESELISRMDKMETLLERTLEKFEDTNS